MATETIKVKQLSKFGVQLEDGQYVNWSKKIQDAEKGKIVPGGSYTVDMFRAESGKGYINSVVGSAVAATAPAIVAPVFAKTPVAKPLPAKAAASETMTKAEWGAKDRSQLIGGLSHDAAQLVHAASVANRDIKAIVAEYQFTLQALIDIREEVK